MVFFDGRTGWVDEGRAVDVAFDTITHNILLGKHRLDEWLVKWIENWLNGKRGLSSPALSLVGGL